ncbi:hypothetical protein [Empedobacter sp. UBA6322]|uniref:hypothetical protein n=1 Tax=Empedobacter sp. UBA6322 TaxID=1946446 RepID=UPI0025C4920B|nr:hypothetical protein [Empedobacter sp. UBA6322]
MSKAEKFRSLFLQESFLQILNTRNEYNLLIEALTEEDLNILIEKNVFFTRTYSPSAIMELKNVPACETMKIVTFEANYHKLFLPEEVVAIILHEIGHAINFEMNGIEAEFAADDFAKNKGYAKWIIRGLEKGLELNLIGFEKETIELRKENLYKSASI